MYGSWVGIEDLPEPERSSTFEPDRGPIVRVMGQWGPGIFEGDSPQEMRALFERRLKAGASVEEAGAAVRESYGRFFEHEPNLLFALADLQMEAGRLEAPVYYQALNALETGADHRMNWVENSVECRQRVLERFRERLHAARPKRRRARNISEIFYALPGGRRRRSTEIQKGEGRDT